MDEYNRKKSTRGFGFPRRGSNLAFRETNLEARNMQYCNRLGCSTRFDSMKGTQFASPEKPKYPKASFRPASSKSIIGSSSKPFATSANFRKSYQERPNGISLRDKAESSSRQKVAEEGESSSQQEDSEGSEFSPISRGFQIVQPDAQDFESPTLQGVSTNSTKSSSSRPRKQINRQLGSNSQGTANSSSSAQRFVASRSMNQATKPSSQYLGSGPPRYGLKNLSCSSISDVLPSGCSSSDLGSSRRVASVRKRPSEGESSSSGGRSTSGSSSSSLSGPSGSVLPQQTLRVAKNRPTSRDVPISVRTRRIPGGETRMRLPEQQDNSIVLVSQPVLYPQLPHTQLSITEAVPESSSRSFPMEPPPVFHNSFGGRPSSSARSARTRLISSRPEDSSTRSPSAERDGYPRFNMEGIAEVLLALERIEQDDELTYEQLMVLETNLFLGSFSFHDQHRDMRLDIDNMSYEELLALEEKMGNVSTALSEEALSKCLKRSTYMPACHFPEITAQGGDDSKCSVCQEEYDVGDEVGKLTCDHLYHVNCINQWLRQKNWCPICKSSVSAPS